jgi:hypothetical protein
LALTCLFFPSGATPGPFPLSFGKRRRLFAKELDSATKLALLRLIHHLVTVSVTLFFQSLIDLNL